MAKVKILDIIPESLREDLFIEVQEELEKRQKEEKDKKNQLATKEEIEKIWSKMHN